MSKGDPNNPVDLSPTGTKEYLERIAAAKTGDLPVGGVKLPNIPRLDQPPPGAPRDRGLGVQQSHAQQVGAQRPDVAKAMTPQQYQQGVKDGSVMPGIGGAYHANQPGRVQIPPEGPQEGAPPPMEITGQGDQPANPPRAAGAGLNPETIRQLEAVAEANANEAKEVIKEVEKEVKDDYDYGELGRVTKDILANKERREAIEAHIEDELNYEDLIINRELRQEVPILPKFRPTYRTPTGEEDLFVKREISSEDGSSQYIMDKFASMGLCCGLYSLNGKPFPSHLDKDGVPDKELFAEKYKIILKYPMVLVADMSANFLWFTERVQGLLALDKVKDF